MTGPDLTIALSTGRRQFAPGETLSGSCSIDGLDPDRVTAVEVSVLWHTEGKGDEDLAVHHFQRIVRENGTPLDLSEPLPFEARLPNAPLSYNGHLVKLRWCVRLRVFLRRGRELVEDLHFDLTTQPVRHEVAV